MTLDNFQCAVLFALAGLLKLRKDRWCDALAHVLYAAAKCRKLEGNTDDAIRRELGDRP